MHEDEEQAAESDAEKIEKRDQPGEGELLGIACPQGQRAPDPGHADRSGDQRQPAPTAPATNA
jgi:hypothetical protein